MNTLRMHFELEKETKGALRYREVTPVGRPHTIEDGAAMGTAYFRKAAFASGKWPKKMYVEATYEEGV